MAPARRQRTTRQAKRLMPPPGRKAPVRRAGQSGVQNARHGAPSKARAPARGEKCFHGAGTGQAPRRRGSARARCATGAPRPCSHAGPARKTPRPARALAGRRGRGQGPAAKTSQKQAPQRHADNAMRPHFCFGGNVFLRQHAPAGGRHGQRKTGRARPLPVFCDAPKRPPRAHGAAAAAPRCAMGRAASAAPRGGAGRAKKPAPVSG